MAEPVHVYRLSDCIERMRRSTESVLIVPCNGDCHSGPASCAHRHVFDPLVDLPLSIIAIHERDLPQILTLLRGASWGHAVLFNAGRIIQHWPQIPTRTELETALAGITPAAPV